MRYIVLLTGTGPPGLTNTLFTPQIVTTEILGMQYVIRKES